MNHRSKKIVVSESSDSSDHSEVVNDESVDSFDMIAMTDEIITPGLVLNGDYVLLKKIGYGNNAGVWMTYRISTKTYYAIKIQDFQCYDDGCREIKILKCISEYIKEQKNTDNIHCVKMLDCFQYSEEKDDGIVFVCSVYELYAGSINTIITTGIYKYGLPIDVVKRITKQLLQSLVVLHNELKVIHTDIKPENILMKGVPQGHVKIIEMFEKKMFQQKYDVIVKKHAANKKLFIEKRDTLAVACVAGLDEIDDPFLCRPATLSDDESESGSIIEGEDDDFSEDGSTEESNEETEESVEPDALNKRRQSIDDLVEHIEYKEIVSIDDLYEFEAVLNNREKTTDTQSIINKKYINKCEIALTDFGNSYFYDRRTKNEIQDRRYRAPEVVLDYNYGYPCDMWSVGCVVYELLTGFPLFLPYDEPLTKDIQHLFLMEKVLGPMPLSMKQKSKRSKFLFDQKRKYHIKNVGKIETIPLKNRLVNQFLFSEKDATECADFILSVLKYNPVSRATAKTMLQHKWLQ